MSRFNAAVVGSFSLAAPDNQLIYLLVACQYGSFRSYCFKWLYPICNYVCSFFSFPSRYHHKAIPKIDINFSGNVSNYSNPATTSVYPVCYCCEKSSQAYLHNKKVPPSIDQYRDTTVSNNVYLCNNGNDYIWKT